jgi:hypothetical protein
MIVSDEYSQSRVIVPVMVDGIQTCATLVVRLVTHHTIEPV